MRIQSIKIPDSIALRTGLKEVEMTKLGQVVVVAGKNGSGKSRLFKLVQLEVQDIPTEEVQIENEDKYAQYTYNKNHWQGQQQAALAKNPPDNMQLRTIQQHLDSNLQELSKLEAGRDRLSRIIIEGNVNPSKVVEFVPKDLNLTDAYTLNEHQLDENSRRIYSKGTGGSSLGTIPAIQKVVRRYSLAKSQVTTASQEENERSIRNFEKLKEYIQLFLSAELGISPDGHAELFGKRIGEAALSDGQKILLQFCLAIYAQETSLNELVIFMDEPENHLHPGALTSVLDKIIEHLSAGQLWISTHSIHILAHFDPSSIWFIEEGKVTYAGTVPQKVLSSLLGNEDEIERLNAFLSLPSQLANYQFSYECLFYPKVAMTGQTDPQVRQIEEIILSLRQNDEKIRVLDFGMGKGRLLATIAENSRLTGTDVREWLDYFGYDKFPTYKQMCEDILKTAYGQTENRYYNDQQRMLSDHPENSFDLIIMTNVLHEIEPSDWITIFTSQINLFKLLKDDGFLLIVEDQLLTIGEKAHAKGFLVLDTLELKKLFAITSSDNYRYKDARGDGKLKAHFIPKAAISRVTATTRKEALETLIDASKDRIRHLRSQPDSYKNGRLHAFWTQQLANSSLALEELSGTPH